MAGVAYIIWPQFANAPQIDDPSATERVSEQKNVPVDEQFATLITYTDGGYSPQTVSIKKGQTVRFVNNAERQDTWPASAIHPTHSIYPQKTDSDCLGSSFDPCHGLKPGEFWEFTFNEVGEWGFHDHLHPSKFGKILVTE
ncbi:MAG: Uncharacterized protein G01um10148_450 [Parcubacteria group bacterium Gr01-1014_8]|nr:MAG: Uncharacterized protein G01um10148_450 [Parcubacteria group bacterium Gr01-1014_8]